jgi:hypothetical protein
VLARRQPLVALAIVVAGAVAGFAICTFGWRESSNRKTPGLSASHIYTLHDGDVILRPDAATRCEASGEGGSPNLFCTRIGGGRHQTHLGFTVTVKVAQSEPPREAPKNTL